jgi:hypothetical protein
MDWFAEWTGARDPYRADEPGSLPPGFASRDANDAYEGYVGQMDVMFSPGRVPSALAALLADAAGAVQSPGLTGSSRLRIR